MKLRRLARWAAGLLLAAGLFAGGGGSAIAQTSPKSPAEPMALLYDQTNNAGSNSADSTDWGSHFSTLSSQAADDFTVPNDFIWHITTATASGGYIGAAGSGVLSLLVQFYGDSNGLPFSRVLSQTIPSANISGLDTGLLAVTLSPTLVIGPGHYWFSAQARVDCTVFNCKHWVWTERSLQFQSASVWQNPAKGVVPYCPTWQLRVDVCHNPPPDSSSGKDLLFKLSGIAAPVVGRVLLPLLRR